MIDIHSHIIPALDDGPAGMDISIAMGRIAAEQGIRAIISTSHSKEGGAAGREEMDRRLAEVRSAWAEAGLDIRIEPGLEIYLQPDTAERLKSGREWGLAGSHYALVELPYQPWPLYADSALFDMQLAGYTPILAHPERYSAIQANTAVMRALAERGVLSQVTGDALLGLHGGVAQNCAEDLIRQGLAQFIASDAHGLAGRKRAPHLRDALHAAEGLVGAAAAHELVYENPAHILEDRPFELSLAPHVKQKRGMWDIFRGGK